MTCIYLIANLANLNKIYDKNEISSRTLPAHQTMSQTVFNNTCRECHRTNF